MGIVGSCCMQTQHEILASQGPGKGIFTMGCISLRPLEVFQWPICWDRESKGMSFQICAALWVEATCCPMGTLSLWKVTLGRVSTLDNGNMLKRFGVSGLCVQQAPCHSHKNSWPPHYKWEVRRGADNNTKGRGYMEDLVRIWTWNVGTVSHTCASLLCAHCHHFYTTYWEPLATVSPISRWGSEKETHLPRVAQLLKLREPNPYPPGSLTLSGQILTLCNII